MPEQTETTEAAALWERRGGIGIITLNRPKALNAVNGALSTAVGTLLEQAENDPDVRVVVVTGSGRAFCAGADLKALATGGNIAAEGHPEWGFAGYAQHWISKPTIAAVNGFALGGGTDWSSPATSRSWTRRRNSGCPRSSADSSPPRAG